MVAISISAEAYLVITGRLPDLSKRDDRGGYALLLDRRTIDRLTAAPCQGESYIYVSRRIAMADGKRGFNESEAARQCRRTRACSG
jgi:hypothetical protein